MIPLHSWLPRAHPAAPSHASALMSGVMVKIGIFGILKVAMDLLAQTGLPLWWGILVMAIGAISALLGVLYALAEQDIKRLLAWSTVENVGIILLAVGVAMVGLSLHDPLLTVVGLLGALFHLLNHALFKGLLFLGAGAIISRLHTHDMEKMGALAKRMPWTAAACLIGCLAISAIPPLNGFISEWYTWQSLFSLSRVEAVALQLAGPIAMVMLAVTGGLAVMCFVKMYGITFCGAPRSTHAEEAQEVPNTMIVAMLLLAALCVLIALSASWLAPKIMHIAHAFTNTPPATVASGIALVLSSTLLGQLLFFEITGGCSWALISYYQSDKAQRSALKALLITHIGSLGLYLAAATLFLQTGTFALSAMSELHGDARYLVYGGILFAAWGKSAQLPMQAWLPDAMEAPTPISAYLHAASMVKVGVYIFARAIIDGGNIPHVIGGVGMVMALVTILYGFLMYLPQQDMKRLLAWSTITQLGWMFFGLSLSIFGSRLALEGSIAYIVNHAFAKSLFFLVAGALSYSCGTRLLPRLRGVLHTLPLPGVGFCVAALAITGVPPFNGFFSKFPLFAAGFALSVEYWILLPAMILLMIESVASFAWFIRWFGRVVPGKPSEAVADAAPLPGSMRLVLIVLIVMSLISSVIAATWLQ